MSAASTSRPRHQSPRPRFTLDGDDEDAEGTADEYELDDVRAVPSIVVQESEPARKPTSSVHGGEEEERDLDREERHVGFAKGADTVIPRDAVSDQDERVGRGDGFVAQEVNEDGRERERAGGLREQSEGTSKEVKKDPAAPFDKPEFAAPAGSTIPVALKRKLPSLPGFLSFAWVKPHLSWKGFRPVVRASVAGWCGLLLSASSSSASPAGLH